TKGLGEASERLMSLINDILDLSTIEAGYMTLDKTEVNIRAMLTGLYDLTLEWARGQKIEVHINCPENIGTGIMDERRVKQGLLNLVRNAIAYTPAGGCITLAAERIGKDIALSVIDNGPGISPEDQTRIFKPFERTATQKNGGAGEQQGGAGLGLSLVKNIVDLHGGKISLKSALGEGTSMTILLPSDADLN
ncbi:MAG: HAMP domain-containing sensor histidine kinase, partial [Pseudomonadota bacterium]